MKRKGWLKVVIPVALVLVLAVSLPLTGGCARAPAEVGPIKIGAPVPLSGPTASDGEEARRGIVMAAEEITAAGGLLGRPLEVISADCGTHTAEENTAARNYLQAQGVDTAFFGYSPDISAMYVFGELDIPYIHVATMLIFEETFMEDPGKYWNVLMGDPSEVKYGPNAYRVFTELLPYEYPNKKIAIETLEHSYSINITQSFIEAATEGGWEIVFDEYHTWGTSDWGVQLTAIRAQNPSIIFFSTFSPEEAAAFVHQFLLDPTESIVYIQYAASIPAFRELAGEEGNGILWQTMIGYLPGNEDWVQRYIQRWGEDPGIALAACYYDYVYWWAQAATAVGSTTDHRAIYEHMITVPYSGLCGRYVVDPVPNSCLSGDDYIPLIFAQIQEGEHVYIYVGTESTGAQFIVPPWLEK